jgi:oligogalacturonide lyase
MTRRQLLTLIPSGFIAAQTRRGGRVPPLPPAKGEFIRYADPLTENPVVRLTMPIYESVLPEPGNRFVSSREGFLVCSTSRGGQMEPFHVNLRSGVLTQLAKAEQLTHRSLALDWSERNLYFIDSGQLRTVDLRRRTAKTIADGITDFHMAGPRDTIVVRRGENLQLISGNNISTTLATGVTSRGLISPLGMGCVFCRRDGPEQHELWYAGLSEKPRLMAEGRISCPRWRPDGQAILFLRQVPREAYVASELREVLLDGSPEHVISETGQFASFAPNGDGSVFVGASRSKAQPSIVLMLRTPRREMVLCEHRSKNAEAVSPAFSPNSQRVYFQSEREGNYCLYSVNVEPLVEKTGEDSG